MAKSSYFGNKRANTLAEEAGSDQDDEDSLDNAPEDDFLDDDEDENGEED